MSERLTNLQSSLLTLNYLQMSAFNEYDVSNECHEVIHNGKENLPLNEYLTRKETNWAVNELTGYHCNIELPWDVNV